MPNRTTSNHSQARKDKDLGHPSPAAEEAKSTVDFDSDSEGFLSPYFREMATVDVMSREEELAAAVKIVGLRRAYWQAILSYPSFIPGICGLARDHLDASALPVAELEAMMIASRRLRDRDLVAHQKAYDVAREALVERLSELDLDCVVSEKILVDLTTIASGSGEPLAMSVKLPRKGSQPFLAYFDAVRGAHHALFAAKNDFVRANLRLVVTIARRFNHGRMPFQDLIQEGNIGLMKAVDRFDHRRGFRFSTYGSWWIRHAISRAIADKARSVRLPVHMIDAYNKVRKARRVFEGEHGRAATDAEIAAITGVSVERIKRMRWSLVESPLSLDQPLADDRDRTMLDALEDPNTVETPDLMEHRVLHQTMLEVFETLAPMEADILRKRMGLDDEHQMTLKEIGERYSLSRERIRQLQEQALGKLRAEFRRRDLMD